MIGRTIFLTLLLPEANSFAPATPFPPTRITTALGDANRIHRELEENSRRKARGGGTGETVAGAVLGGMLLGPFGALFGASIGSNIGANKAVEQAKQKEMERLGVTRDMLEAAQECGAALERSMEGLKATQDSLNTQQSFARLLEKDVDELYDKAMRAVEVGDDAKAKEYLFERIRTQEKLKDALAQCIDAKNRFELMERNVAALEARAKEVEALLTRTVAAKATRDIANEGPMDFSLSQEDPLLKKFRDAGIE